jgi:hypothetical protein
VQSRKRGPRSKREAWPAYWLLVGGRLWRAGGGQRLYGVLSGHWLVLVSVSVSVRLGSWRFCAVWLCVPSSRGREFPERGGVLLRGRCATQLATVSTHLVRPTDTPEHGPTKGPVGVCVAVAVQVRDCAGKVTAKLREHRSHCRTVFGHRQHARAFLQQAASRPARPLARSFASLSTLHLLYRFSLFRPSSASRP